MLRRPAPDDTSRSRRRPLAVVLTVLGVLLLLGAAVGVAYPLWWQHRSKVVGNHLLHEDLTPPSVSVGSQTASCSGSLPSPSSASMHLAGILEVPSLSLRAPVLQGLGDPVLNVAVGHDPSSPWPGGPGESIVEAHDVSYFSKIDALHKGETVLWRDACQETVFKVTSSTVTTPGAFLKTPPVGKGLALITCYPTNALFWTPDRFVVETAFVSQRTTAAKPSVVQVIPHLHVPAPAPLVAEGLTLQDNPLLLGRLNVAGTPAPGFSEGPGPLDVEADALESFFGAEKAIGQHNTSWWQALSVPGLPMPPAWSDATPIYVTVEVSGTTVQRVVLQSENVTMTLVVEKGTLLIQSVRSA